MTASGVVIGDDGLARPAWATQDELLRHYYDTEWGMPVTDEHGVFERLSLEAFQSGLSWRTILAKRENFRTAFAGFDPEAVADFTDDDVARLLADTGIVRNRAKILATVANAQATLELRGAEDLPDDVRDLAGLVWSFQPEVTPAPTTLQEVPTESAASRALAKTLRARGFRFVGPTTMFALMEAIGIIDTHLVDSHRRGSSGIW